MTDDRKTFTIPNGFHAERDPEGRATGYLIRYTDGKRFHHTDVAKFARDDYTKIILFVPPKNNYPLLWWFGSTDQCFTDHFENREDAVDYARENGGGYIVQARQQDFSMKPDAEDLFERLMDRNEERSNEDGDFVTANPAQTKELEELLEATILHWAHKNGISLRAWSFDDDMTTPEYIEGEE